MPTSRSATRARRVPTSSRTTREGIIATAYDFIISGDQAAAREAAHAALAEAGFQLEVAPNGYTTAARGSMAKTMLLGAMAGKNFRIVFPVEYYSGPAGELIVRLSRNLSGGALGGALGVNKTNNAFIETVEKVGASLTSRGILASTVAHD